MDCSVPDFPVLHHLPELTQIPSHPLLSPSPPAFHLSHHQNLFRRVELVVMKFSFDIFQASSSLVDKFPFADAEGQGAEDMESRKRDKALHAMRITYVDTSVASERLLQELIEVITAWMKQPANCCDLRLRRWPLASP